MWCISKKGSFSVVVVALTSVLFVQCATTRQNFVPERKFSQDDLQRDYQIFRNILEESHPSLYWFTPVDSMNYFFDKGYSLIQDSMTEQQFRNVLTYVVTQVRCGHTSVRASRQFSRYLDTSRLKWFPLGLKIWSDTMVVTSNLNRKDSLFKRGVRITAIDGHPVKEMIDTMFYYVASDGNAITGKYQSLSNRGTFASLYRNLYGMRDTLLVTYIDTLNREQTVALPLYDPAKDSLRFSFFSGYPTNQRTPRKTRLMAARNVQIDTALGSAYMVINTFSRGTAMKKFLKKSFRAIDKMNLRHLVIDVRSNGGGDAGNSTLLTQYLINRKFRLADSLYAVRRTTSYGKYIEWQPVYWTMMRFVTRKRADGKYHFGFFERHAFKPRKKHHYDGNIYILTGGNSFSATTLFAQSLKGQRNVTIIGEETGGGAYGNSAWMIPDVTLPNTRVRFRLPKFRLVMNKDLVKEGRGVMPDIWVGPTIEAIKKGIDPKVEAAREMIKMHNRMVQVVREQDSGGQ